MRDIVVTGCASADGNRMIARCSGSTSIGRKHHTGKDCVSITIIEGSTRSKCESGVRCTVNFTLVICGDSQRCFLYFEGACDMNNIIIVGYTATNGNYMITYSSSRTRIGAEIHSGYNRVIITVVEGSARCVGKRGFNCTVNFALVICGNSELCFRNR